MSAHRSAISLTPNLILSVCREGKGREGWKDTGIPSLFMQGKKPCLFHELLYTIQYNMSVRCCLENQANFHTAPWTIIMYIQSSKIWMKSCSSKKNNRMFPMMKPTLMFLLTLSYKITLHSTMYIIKCTCQINQCNRAQRNWLHTSMGTSATTQLAVYYTSYLGFVCVLNYIYTPTQGSDMSQPCIYLLNTKYQIKHLNTNSYMFWW
jgi:hypothetical protein